MNFSGKNIFVTGAAGFIGSHLCKRLIADGFRVTGVDNLSRGKRTNLQDILHHPNFAWFELDAADDNLLNTLQVDQVVHLASGKIPRYSTGWDLLQESSRLNQGILKYCIEKKTRLLFASTSDVYGKNPHIPFTETSECMIGSPENKRWAYAMSKLHAEHLLTAAGREFGLSYQIMRFFGCYGPNMAEGWWGGPQSVFLQNALEGEPFEIHGDGLQTRSYIYIDDLVEGIVQIVKHPELESGIWNLCNSPDDAISVVELATRIQQLVDPKQEARFNYVPYAHFGQYEDVRHRSGSALKAETLLGWKPKIDLDEGLKRCLDARR